jgi:hypothetical protein
METGYITIETYPHGAKIYVDNVLVLDEKEEYIPTPAVLVVFEGYHSIRLELEDYCDEFDGQYIMENDNVRIFHNFNICQ